MTLTVPDIYEKLSLFSYYSCGQRLREIHTAKFVAAAEDATLVYLD